MCDAGKVEPHGLIRLLGTIDGVNKVLFPDEIPAGNRPLGELARRIAPRPCAIPDAGDDANTVTLLLLFFTKRTVSALATSRITEKDVEKSAPKSIGLTDLFTIG